MPGTCNPLRRGQGPRPLALLPMKALLALWSSCKQACWGASGSLRGTLVLRKHLENGTCLGVWQTQNGSGFPGPRRGGRRGGACWRGWAARPRRTGSLAPRGSCGRPPAPGRSCWASPRCRATSTLCAASPSWCGRLPCYTLCAIVLCIPGSAAWSAAAPGARCA